MYNSFSIYYRITYNLTTLNLNTAINQARSRITNYILKAAVNVPAKFKFSPTREKGPRRHILGDSSVRPDLSAFVNYAGILTNPRRGADLTKRRHRQR